MKTKHALLVALLALGTLHSALSTAEAQGTAFIYQGQLSASGSPAGGNYDFTFALFNNNSTNTGQVGGTQTNLDVGVTNGLFIVTLNFGGVFTGTNYWLSIGVRTNGGASFTALNPLQALTPTPYAIMAYSTSNLLGTIPAAQLSGAVGNSQLANSSITVNAGTGLSGGGPVALGGATALTNTGVLSVAGNADITASTVGGAVTLGDTATSANTASTIVKRDSTGSFSADNLTLNGALTLPALSGTSSNTIYSGGNLLLYADTHQNFFSGQGAGNLTTGGLGGLNNTAAGFGALSNNTSGSYNAAGGAYALYENTSGTGNTANGDGTLYGNKGGFYNTASGYNALVANTSGSDNTASGANALLASISGTGNTAMGMFALNSNTNGSYNIALGYQAGGNIIAGSSNIDIGNGGLATDTNIIRIGSNQVAAYITGVINGNGGGLTNLAAASLTGSGTLPPGVLPATLPAINGANLTSLNASQLTSIGNSSGGIGNFFLGSGGNATTSGQYNTAAGLNALAGNTGGSDNTAYGSGVLHANTSGADNTAAGLNALHVNTTGFDNTAYGSGALSGNSTGSDNIALGYNAGANISTTGGNIDIGNQGVSGDINIIRLGSSQTATYIAGTLNGNNGLSIGTNIYLDNNPMYLRNDMNHGLAYCGNGITNFPNTNVQPDGPVLWGYTGGALGVLNGGAQAMLSWSNSGVSITGGLSVPVLTITGGSDVAEPFEISGNNIPKGAVVIIDENHPGHLKLSDQPYDPRVAGIVSGANGVNPGISLRQMKVLEGSQNVALSGRVYVLADASSGAIRPGDLLTTSATPGHAMKVIDHAKAQGAIIGKAMSGLKEGKGMVLVLVSLQ